MEISMADTEKKDVLILALESSCDETAAAVVKNGRTVLSNIISSQIDLHTLYILYNKKAIKKNKKHKRKILITTNAIRIMEAPPRFELGHKAFAELCLTTWLWCHIAKGFK